MNTIDEKRKVWETPEIVDLDLKKTNSGASASSVEQDTYPTTHS
jgi:hypothetical protein